MCSLVIGLLIFAGIKFFDIINSISLVYKLSDKGKFYKFRFNSSLSEVDLKRKIDIIDSRCGFCLFIPCTISDLRRAKISGISLEKENGIFV